MFKGTMTKWPVQKQAQGMTQKLLQHHDATDIKTARNTQNNTTQQAFRMNFFSVSIFYLYLNLLK